ncbi:MAG: 2-C-methyl-D-erythritol 4-phosphate cytidylyltransferase [Candidatus Eremiobacter antarcticus]|nr:2-C-methyl-D-erythritol 4-phosphate cytidylyltransferase [Candidatus Eremiobacteraeota bacterium]MBC5808653.1 2-C-methyl-D-erythritol 4-phosphate cytidylyltransferase [Candidatus Eremiobacteraeota bacterium]PZR62143.1 MAG: 2-C-methyl-D-erythritol 4-phosphate cytidylyltransferase [Candidatus Eremiobacter sp. RRmetagenome_bin22]
MGRPKQLMELGGKPVVAWSLQVLASCELIDEMVIACERDDQPSFTRLAATFGGGKVGRIVLGGERRQDSVFAALREVSEHIDIVVVHDGARPFVTHSVVAAVIRASVDCGAAISAVPVTDTIKQSNDAGAVLKTIPRERLWAAQTPQAFSRRRLYEAHEQAEADGYVGTDDAELVERLGSVPIAIVAGSYENLKITTPEDLIHAERVLARRALERPSDGGLSASAAARQDRRAGRLRQERS